MGPMSLICGMWDGMILLIIIKNMKDNKIKKTVNNLFFFIISVVITIIIIKLTNQIINRDEGVQVFK